LKASEAFGTQLSYFAPDALPPSSHVCFYFERLEIASFPNMIA
jgi:hypothetical protein